MPMWSCISPTSAPQGTPRPETHPLPPRPWSLAPVLVSALAFLRRKPEQLMALSSGTNPRLSPGLTCSPVQSANGLQLQTPARGPRQAGCGGPSGGCRMGTREAFLMGAGASSKRLALGQARATGPSPHGGLVETLCYLGGSWARGSQRVCHCAHTTTQSTPPPRPSQRGLVGGSWWHSQGLAGTARPGRGRTMARGSPRPPPRALHSMGELRPQAAPQHPAPYPGLAPQR